VCCAQDLSGGKLCTFNLHLLACQLLMQVVHRGLTAPLGELWIERLVGRNKGRSKGCTRLHPEVTMIIDELVMRALRRARLKYAHLNLQTWQEYMGRDAPLGVPRSVLLAEGHLMGKPKPFAAEAWGALQNLVKEKLSINLEPDEWQPWEARWSRVVVQQYQRAALPGGSYATSMLYPLSRSRDGTWVMVQYVEGNAVKAYVARVKYFLRLSLPAAVGEQVVRLAMCDFLPYRQPLTDPDICDHVLFSTVSRDSKGSILQSSFTAGQNYPVLLSHITAPLFVNAYGEGNKQLAFVPFRFTTGGAGRLR
jgi:hypothetical protein